METLFKMVDGITYTRSIPKEAEEYAKENGFVVIVGGSDNLMYAFGADSYLTNRCEHGYGWDGDTLENIEDKCLENEARQLGLKIFWCGVILDYNQNVIDKIQGYDKEKQGAFSYSVKNGIEHKHFVVYEDEKKDKVYCMGIIIKLPKKFKPSCEETGCIRDI